jgi:signal transduction histidine kinase
VTRTLRTRIVLSFVSFAVCVAAVFGFAAAVFLYTVEDSFFESIVREEATRLETLASNPRASGSIWAQPSVPYMFVYESIAQLPRDLQAQVALQPERREFAGDSGRHYHVRALFPERSPPAAWLVAEVSDRLVVRPMRRALLADWLLVGGVLLAVAVVLALRVARRIAQPLTTLAQEVHRLDVMAAQPIVVHNADAEIQVVIRALDDMRTRVQAFVAREQLFTRDASHELRTPLSVIRSTTAQALADPGVSTSTRQLLQLALQGAEQLERTTASLLALAREHPLSEVDAHTQVLPVLERVVLEQTAMRDTSTVSLDIDVSRTDTLPIAGSVLNILLSNLIGNAFAHSAPGVVRVSMRDGVLRINNPVLQGVVIPHPATLMSDGVRREGSPGDGLGLSIVRRLCERSGLLLTVTADHVHGFDVSLQPR